MTCTHHWLIEMANGPTSEGVCRLCGATGTFRNSIEEWTPDDKVKIHSMRVTAGGPLVWAEAYQE